jgi:hypothetical protein
MEDYTMSEEQLQTMIELLHVIIDRLEEIRDKPS